MGGIQEGKLKMRRGKCRKTEEIQTEGDDGKKLSFQCPVNVQKVIADRHVIEATRKI
jgi:hypothetical protein